MKLLKKLSLLLLIIFVGIQFVPTNKNQSNEVLETDFMQTFAVPIKVKNLIITSCYDCHSNNTKYPWYSKTQPAAWIMEGHIEEGKEELNFSEFGKYSKRKKKAKLKSIISGVNDDMPLFSYTMIHRDAVLSESEKATIIDWVEGLQSRLE